MNPVRGCVGHDVPEEKPEPINRMFLEFLAALRAFLEDKERANRTVKVEWTLE
ncbi:MAG TPA: hypothetical protein VK579_17650 [Terriglobales bacterium]|nr:hypothetical protein [Terriglobales bacterium]